MFGNLKKDDRKMVVIDWMRNMPAADMLKKKNVSIPFLLHEDDNSDEYQNLRVSKICTSAMLDLLEKNIGGLSAGSMPRKKLFPPMPGSAGLQTTSENGTLFSKKISKPILRC
jgi:hypothetical protein